MPKPQVSSINIYPIKSCRGISVSSAVVEERGLALDRRYMLVDDRGRFLTQREHPRMALIRVSIVDDEYLVEVPDRPALRLPREMTVARERRVKIWRSSLAAGLADAPVNRWFTDYMELDCSLVYMGERHHRAVPNAAAQFDDEVSFADAGPLLLISEASLADLNSRLDQRLTMQRFRPNLVVTADEPFDEDGWRRIRIGQTEFEVGWPCPRCVMTTIDPDTGVKDAGGEPLATLKTYRRAHRGVMFGCNLLIRRLGEIRVGDAVQVQ